jgi:pimeloyl-ACP methyl ester carboxylesterase
MHHAVVCTEDAPYIDADAETLSAMAATYLGLDPLIALRATCADWPVGTIHEDFKQPVESDVPVLLLSGEADPITPPLYGDQVAAYLQNALHIVNPGQAHIQAWLGCTPTIMARFIDRGRVEDIDYGCLDRVQPPPFFIDPNGPLP